MFRKRSRVVLSTITTAALAVTAMLGSGAAATAQPAALEAPAAVAAQLPASAATLDWGVKQSFVSYVSGQIAHGTVTPLGATERSGSTFSWSSGTGSVAEDRASGELQFGAADGVRFVGHDGLLDTSLTHPRVEITSATTAEMYVDAEGLSYPQAVPYHAENVHLANITLPEPTIEGGAVKWSGASAKLTEAGEVVFANFYPAGTGLDPVTLSTGDIGATPPAPTATATTLTTSSTSVLVGKPVTLRAGVAPTSAIGTVQFFEGATPLGSAVATQAGVAQFETRFAKSGSRQITARFVPGDGAAYSGSTSTAVAVAARAVPTTTTISFAPATVAYNSMTTATVKVRASENLVVPAGKVTLKVAGKAYSASLTNGAATVKLTAPISVGSNAVSATYAPSSTLVTSTSTKSTTLKVTKATPSVAAKLAKSKVSARQNAQLSVTVKVPGTLGAKASKLSVQVYDGSKKIKTSTLSTTGTAKISVPKLRAGAHKLTVKFVSSKNLNAKSSAAVKLTVTK